MELFRIAELLRPFLEEPVPFLPDSKLAHSADSDSTKNAGALRALSPAQLKDISTYIDILCRWNARMNLTAIREPEQIVTRHFGESFFTARCLFPSGNSEASVADVGSGAGFPGIPIKLWAPRISATLIESNQKKAVFLREVLRALTLADSAVQNARAESLPPGAFDVVCLRAVERFEMTLPVAAGLVKPGGLLALLLGAAQVGAASSILSNWKLSLPGAIPDSGSRVVLFGRPRAR